MQKLVLFAGLIVSIFLINHPLIAQEEEEEDYCSECMMGLDALWNLEVLSASRKVQKNNDAAGSVVVITDEMIQQRGYRNLEEVLEDIPGIDFTIKQPAGEYPSHFIFRGITDVGQTNLLILVDGVIRNDISNGWIRHIGFEFPLIDIERIEVIFGPGSSLYGANAYAGIIYIITKNAEDLKDKNKVDARISYGSFNSISPEIYYSSKFENGMSVQVTGQWYITDGDQGLERLDPGNYFHNNSEPDSVLTTEYGNIPNEIDGDGLTYPINDGFKTNINDMHFRVKAKHENFTIGLSWWQRDEGLGSQVVGYEYFTNSPNLNYRALHTGKTFYTKYEFELKDNFYSSSILSYRNTRILPETGFFYTYQYQSVNNGFDSAVVDKMKGYSGEGTAIRLEQQFNLDIKENNELVFGFHVENENKQYFGISLGEAQDPNSTIVSSTYPDGNESYLPMHFSQNYSLFVQDQMKIFEKYTITGGLRYDYSSEFGYVLVPRAAFVGNPFKNFYFKALYGKAFKAPTVFELFDEWRGNADLKPQYISTYELELSYRITEKINVRLNTFTSQVNDLIVVAPNPDPFAVPIGANGEKATYYQNQGEFNISGLSLMTDYQPLKDMLISANYSFTIGENFDEIDNIARMKANLAINYVLQEKINFNLRANFIGKVKAAETNRYFQPKTTASIAEVGYDYVTEDKPDGYLDEYMVLNFTISGRNLFRSKVKFEPQLIIRNMIGADYFTIGRQSGSGTRPIDVIQTSIQNPTGFIPAYHPQAGTSVYFRLLMRF
ncbi:MAG: TonB-dependent receptor [Bacteroidetes bacterium]|nr:TonB-dependent receptor [Bacteroidota bacterium]